jgi:hypothetical protein
VLRVFGGRKFVDQCDSGSWSVRIGHVPLSYGDWRSGIRRALRLRRPEFVDPVFARLDRGFSVEQRRWVVRAVLALVLFSLLPFSISDEATDFGVACLRECLL